MMHRRLLGLILVGLLLSKAVWAGSVKASKSETVMGMPVTITVWDFDDAACARDLKAGFAELKRVEQLFSVYRQGSQINEINQYASRRPVVVSKEVMSVLIWARSISELTQGAFDVTAAGFAWEYGFGQGDYRIPSNMRLEEVKNWVGYKKIMLVPEDRTVLFKRDGVQIDLGGIAKSHALNTVRSVLTKTGVKAAWVNAGGDVVFVHAKPEGGAWTVGVKNPFDPDRLLTTVEVAGGKVLSSGDYERYFEQDGVRIHHILDPATGKPARFASGATLYLPENTKIDLPSVALMLMPPEKALALVQTIPGAEALIVDPEKKVWLTPGWEKQLKLTW